MDTKGEFYLGRIFDPAKGKASDQPCSTTRLT